LMDDLVALKPIQLRRCPISSLEMGTNYALSTL
jgi:hypothetical protein